MSSSGMDSNSLLLYGAFPLGVPPPGVVPNYANPANRTYQLIITVAVCTVLMVTALAIRFYSKLRVTRNLSWDDYTAGFAAAGAITYAALALAIHRSGYGRHNWEQHVYDLNDQQSQMVDANNSMYGIIMLFAKLSLFLLLLRLFGKLRWMRILVYIGIVFNTLYSVACFIAFWVMCAPPYGESWTLYLDSPKCIQTIQLGYTQSSLNIVCDFYLLLIPIPAVMGLQLPLKKKIGIILVFMTGLVACIASCVALWLRIDIDNNPDDKLWHTTPISMVSYIEISFTVTCSCIPAFSALIRKHSAFFQSFLSIFTTGRFSKISSDGPSNFDSNRGVKSTASKKTGYPGRPFTSEGHEPIITKQTAIAMHSYPVDDLERGDREKAATPFDSHNYVPSQAQRERRW